MTALAPSTRSTLTSASVTRTPSAKRTPTTQKRPSFWKLLLRALASVVA